MKSDGLKLVVALVAFFALVGLGGVVSVPWVSAQDQEVSIGDLKRNSKQHLKKKVLVKGKLRSTGQNYFTDPRFVVEDEAGNQISVDVWAPLEIPPPMPGREEIFMKNRPKVMKDYFGRNLSVTGVLREAPVRGRASGDKKPRSFGDGAADEAFIEVESVVEDEGNSPISD